MTNTKYAYLSIPKALELGYPDIRGTKKDERPFCRYIIHKISGNVIAKYKTKKEIEQRSMYKITRTKKYLKLIQRYKVFCGCQKCGYKEHPVALHLNHIDPMQKKGMLSSMIQNSGIDKLKKEIRKCEVLCANCHAIHTYKEKQWLVDRGDTRCSTET